jgi:hypothetical protein
VSGNDKNDRSWNETTPPPLDEIHAGHDRLASAWFVGKQEAQPGLGQHVVEYRFVLVRVGPKRARREHRRPEARARVLHPSPPEAREPCLRLTLAIVFRYAGSGELSGAHRAIVEIAARTPDDEVDSSFGHRCHLDGDDLPVEMETFASSRRLNGSHHRATRWIRRLLTVALQTGRGER